MNGSIMERIFPPSRPLLPQYEVALRRDLQSPKSPGRIVLEGSRSSSPAATLSTSRSQKSLRSAPLSASFVHHEDPFLPVERAAKALQSTIQALLNIQANKLSGRMNGDNVEREMSTGNVTPTQDSTTHTGNFRHTIPVRQPVTKPISLNAARKGLVKSMQDLSKLRIEELKLLDAEETARVSATALAQGLEDRREALSSEIQNIRQRESSETVASLREQARLVQMEIDELETRLIELRDRHRLLNAKADRTESSLDAQLSSYQNSISMIDKDVKAFLKRPPITHALTESSSSTSQGMYDLRPERRTLQMAKAQWTTEQDVIKHRRSRAENERKALDEGSKIWSRALGKITKFESLLRSQTRAMASSTSLIESQSSNTWNASDNNPLDDILDELDDVISELEADRVKAEAENWTLLICALGAELEAFYQARLVLRQTLGRYDHEQEAGDDNQEEVEEKLLHDFEAKAWSKPDRDVTASPTNSNVSNQSLKDTLTDFHKPDHEHVAPLVPVSDVTHRDESEDDEPPADFMISH